MLLVLVYLVLVAAATLAAIVFWILLLRQRLSDPENDGLTFWTFLLAFLLVIVYVPGFLTGVFK